MSVQRLSVGIVGAGLMGHGIAQVFAVAGAKVRVFDPSPEALGSLRLRVASNFLALGLPLDLVEAIEPVDSISAAVASASLIIEAAPEDIALKRKIFAELAECTDADAILASNTSVISIGEIAADQAAANRIVGTHWWNPPYLVPLVEVIEHGATDSGSGGEDDDDAHRCRQDSRPRPSRHTRLRRQPPPTRDVAGGDGPARRGGLRSGDHRQPSSARASAPASPRSARSRTPTSSAST